MSLGWSQPYEVAHVMRFQADHWVSLCGRYEIKPEDWRPYWEAHPGGDPPLRFTFDARPSGRWCLVCDKAAANMVRALADLPSVRVLLGVSPPCPT